MFVTPDASTEIFFTCRRGVSDLMQLTISGQVAEGTETLLVVNDNEVAPALSRTILKKLGYTAVCANCREAAWAMRVRYGDGIGLVISDPGIPGLGGGKRLDQLIRNDPDIQVIIASGNSEDGSVKTPSNRVPKPRSSSPIP